MTNRLEEITEYETLEIENNAANYEKDLTMFNAENENENNMELYNNGNDIHHLPRSKIKEDIFHQFQNLPLKKISIKSHVHQLLISAIFNMVESDHLNVG